MDLEADFWHGKVKTYLVSYKLFKFYAKPKKSADLAHFWKFAVLASNGKKYFSQMDLKADFWHG